MDDSWDVEKFDGEYHWEDEEDDFDKITLHGYDYKLSKEISKARGFA